ncbi:cell adhesion molecule CEACAM6-like isoform 1-T1 [Trichechus inunguis]
MEPPSATPRRRLVHWLGSLLTVSLLIFWSPSITAQPTIESVPFNAAEGNDVLLLLRNPPTDTLIYIWYKGESRDHNNRIASYLTGATQPNATGPAHSGQETIYPNGSLLFQNVTLEDTGIYTLQITKTNGDNEALAGQIRVHPELPKPFITSNSSNPVEDQDSVTLTCDPETQNTTYQWLINHQSLPDRARLELSTDNRILTIYNVTRNDKGPYECETWNPVNARRSDPFILNVLYGPDTPTISPSDWHYPPGANLTLSCNAISNPPAQYSWLISGNYLQSTQVLFIPNVTVSDGGSYICHVRSNATGLSRTTVKTITVSDDGSEGAWNISAGAITDIVTAILVGMAVVTTLGCFLLSRTRGASGQSDLGHQQPLTSTPGHGQSDSSASPAPGMAPAVPIYEVSVDHECAGPTGPWKTRTCPTPCLAII